jgi:hypothetical protein
MRRHGNMGTASDSNPPRGFPEALRFATDVATDPGGVVTLWKSATGGKAAGCLPRTPVPELLHAAGLLPIPFDSIGDLSRFIGLLDALLVGPEVFRFPDCPGGMPRFTFPGAPPGTLEEALDRIEALAEWAGAVSGSPPSEGALRKAMRTFALRRSLLCALDERCERETAFLTPAVRGDVVRAGHFLPPDAHSRLLSSILRMDHPAAPTPVEGERGDPLIVLARRLL